MNFLSKPVLEDGISEVFAELRSGDSRQREGAALQLPFKAERLVFILMLLFRLPAALQHSALLLLLNSATHTHVHKRALSPGAFSKPFSGFSALAVLSGRRRAAEFKHCSQFGVVHPFTLLDGQGGAE